MSTLSTPQLRFIHHLMQQNGLQIPAFEHLPHTNKAHYTAQEQRAIEAYCDAEQQVLSLLSCSRLQA